VLPARQAVIRWSRDSESERTVEPVFEKAVVEDMPRQPAAGANRKPRTAKTRNARASTRSLNSHSLTTSDRL
jgi:hypothetical protein